MLSEALAPLAASPSLLLAVSGGPDSLALMHAAVAAFPTKRIAAATVDHGLRPEAAAEADFVAARAASLGIAHFTLRLDAPPRRAVQASARHGRYRLLAALARREGFSAIVTAHHAGDQAETVAMRIARGSGLAGLAGIRAHSAFDGVRVMRPLLGIAPEELREIALGFGPVVDDPSNADTRFERVRVRRALDANARTRLNGIAARAGAIRTRREVAIAGLIGRCLAFDAHGNAVASREALAEEPAARLAEALSFAAAAIAGRAHRPARDAVRRFAASVLAGRGATLGGCRALVAGEKVFLFREWGRCGPAAAAPGAPVWDKRFALSGNADVAIGPLGDNAFEDVLRERFSYLPSAARRVLPAVFSPAGDFVAVAGGDPHMAARATWTGEARLSLLGAPASAAFTKFGDRAGASLSKARPRPYVKETTRVGHSPDAGPHNIEASRHT
ncbi:MAG: tRNA lysidine(34) synthetase TilS [Flavobacteriaceae bacterium]